MSVEPWGSSWADDPRSAVRTPTPGGDFPANGWACAGCPGVSQRSCCQHIERHRFEGLPTVIPAASPLPCMCFVCRFRRRFQRKESP